MWRAWYDRSVNFPMLPNPAKAPVMLAHRWEPGCPIDPTGYRMSEKLDGVRGYWDGKNLISRQGNVFAAPKWFTAGFPSTPLDGELFMGRGTFNEASGIVRRERPHEGWKFLTYLVFDLPKHTGTWEERQAELKKIVEDADFRFLQMVPSVPVTSKKQVLDMLERVEALGGEGLMLVQPGSRYEARRTHCLLKVKTFKDAEGIVVGYEPGKGRHAGRMGALRVEGADGSRFKVGTGFSDEERNRAKELFPIGTTVTYRYFETTPKGVPRFPSYLRVRAEEPKRNPWVGGSPPPAIQEDLCRKSRPGGVLEHWNVPGCDKLVRETNAPRLRRRLLR